MKVRGEEHKMKWGKRGCDLSGKMYQEKIHNSRIDRPRPRETFKMQSYPAASPWDWKRPMQAEHYSDGAGRHMKLSITISQN